MFFFQVNAERVVYYRERASNMYPVLFYSLSWTLAEVHKFYIHVSECINYLHVSYAMQNLINIMGGIRMEK